MTSKEVINFNVNDARIAEAAQEFKAVDAYQDLDAAKTAKKVLTKMRTTLSAAHKEQKAESLAYGRMLDAEKNRLLEMIAKIEDPITEQLNEIKNAEAKKEEDRLAKIQLGLDGITMFAEGRHDLTVSQLEERLKGVEQTEITEEVFQERTDDANDLLAEVRSKLNIVLRAAREREEEAARLEEQRKRQAEEDERLRKEREAFEAEKRAAREAEERKAAAELAKEEARLKKEREELEARQREQAEREAAERKEKEAREAEERRLAAAPDVEKLERLADTILSTPIPTCDSDEGIAVVSMVQHTMKDLADHVLARVGEMK